MSDLHKITEAHRRRRAVVYVRQSTAAQLERNHESRARQYALRERAIELGWPAATVSVVDEDLGRSGASTDGRLGFKELVAEVGLGHVGLVLALEVSRFARSSADWHQLLDLCALTGTLIADSDGIYSPNDFNDRLLLGLKGTMSEAELHLIRARLDGGLRNKAKRGELEMNLPVGLDRVETGVITLAADEQVRHAIERVFELWRRLGSARQVVRELIAEDQKLPHRTIGSRRVRWVWASYGATKPRSDWGVRVKRFCIRSNAVSCTPSRSSKDGAKAYEFRCCSPRLDCLTNDDGEEGSVTMGRLGRIRTAPLGGRSGPGSGARAGP
jgi:DNA invertase Pin-like site-specific DNA recombinase